MDEKSFQGSSSITLLRLARDLCKLPLDFEKYSILDQAISASLLLHWLRHYFRLSWQHANISLFFRRCSWDGECECDAFVEPVSLVAVLSSQRALADSTIVCALDLKDHGWFCSDEIRS